MFYPVDSQCVVYAQKMTEVIIDDFEMARDFISKLPKAIKRKRFNRYASNGVPDGWNPHHCALAIKNDKPVALADYVGTEESPGAYLAIVANDGEGVYAIKAMQELKRLFPKTFWGSTVRELTPRLEKISFRYIDYTYDLMARDLSDALVENYGIHQLFQPIPLFPSKNRLKYYGLPRLNAWEQSTKDQMIVSTLDISIPIISPSGRQVIPPDRVAMTFEILGLEYAARQKHTRAMLINSAMVLGHNVKSNFFQRHLKDKDAISFTQKLSEAARLSRLNEDIGLGLFRLAG